VTLDIESTYKGNIQIIGPIMKISFSTHDLLDPSFLCLYKYTTTYLNAWVIVAFRSSLNQK